MRSALALAIMFACGGTDDTATAPPPVTTDTSSSTTAGATQQTVVGTPSWRVSSVTLFTAPLDPSTASCVLGANHQEISGVYGPGDAHLGPYDSEIANGAAACGFRADSTFTSAEFSGGQGVWFGLVLLPTGGGVAGSSPDFDSGDVINWDRFPMLFDGDVRRGPFTIADGDLDGLFPGPDDFGFSVNGHSHVIMLLGSAVERMPLGATPPGEYTFNLNLRDATSDVSEAGWDVVAPFIVADPE